MFGRLKKHPLFIKLLINSYAPYLGAGVRVTDVDMTAGRVRVEMPLTRINRNYVGVHFGGSLYAMVDPFFMLILINQLGEDYIVWDKSASIDFIAPGRGRVHTIMQISPDEVALIRQLASSSQPIYRTYPVEILAEDGKLIAKVEKVLYIRKKR
ncbi:MAG: DUF4442 domain-containing protein [Moraxellaceae bacterium]